MIITRTPFRISFFGGGTDYPVWYREHGGAVLATTINKYCYLSCRWLPPFFEHHSRILYTRVENVRSNDEIQHPSVRACLAHLGIQEGVEIHHDADLPARTGLGSSSAFTVGLLQALYALRQQMRGKQQLAEEAIHVEQQLLQENVGSQDQTMAAWGGLRKVTFHRDGQITPEPVIVSGDRLDWLQRHLLLYFTGFSRTASEIARQQIENTPNRTAELTAIRQMVDEGLDILTNSRRPLEEFGNLLHEGWQMKRRISDRISNSHLDEIYNAGQDAGALGGKLLGAGGGGFMLFFVPVDRQPEFRRKMSRLLHVPFRFESNGAHIITYEPEEEFDGLLVRERERVYATHA